MSVRTNDSRFIYLGNDKFNRCNFKTLNLYKEIKDSSFQVDFVRIKDLFDITSGFAFKSEDYVADGVSLVRIGDLNNEDLEDESMVKLPEEFYTNSQYEKYRIKKNDILVSLTGDGILKCLWVKDNGKYLLNQRVAILRAKKEINHEFYYYLLQIDYVKKQFMYYSNGKSQLNISPFDLANIKVPLVEKSVQDNFLKSISTFKTEIEKLKKNNKKVSTIIDEVFSTEFTLNLDHVYEEDRKKQYETSIKNLSFNNSSLRTSYRWEKAIRLQKIMFSKCDCVEKLGHYVESTQNGWSPSCKDGATKTMVLGIDSINKDTVLRIFNPKFSDKTKKNISDYYIKKNDFFISRGNTPELVALASIVKDDVADNIIFPDLMIRINLSSKVDKQYLAYVINSQIGRLYFKYVSKGKNLSMVKVSSKEINDFMFPLPCKEKQKCINGKIKQKIEELEKNKRLICEKKAEIENILSKQINL